MISFRYSSVDDQEGRTLQFKTIAEARTWAQDMIGKHPEWASWYAISSDGIGKIDCIEGTSFSFLFPKE